MSGCSCSDSLSIGETISWPIQLMDVDLNSLGGQFKAHLVDSFDQYVDSFSFQILNQITNRGKALMQLDTSPWLSDQRQNLAGTMLRFDLVYEMNTGQITVIAPAIYLTVEKSPTLSTLSGGGPL